MLSNKITIKGARVHNLKNINVEIPKNKFVVITGLSGSGKSSLAFDTIYAEGQRRYVESLSSYARNFLELQDKPDVDEIKGLSPTIAIDQRTTSSNPRSTVGTITEVYDFLRLLFARVGKPHCFKCSRLLKKQSRVNISNDIKKFIEREAITIYAPIIKEEKGEHKSVAEIVKRAGLNALRFDGEEIKLEDFREKRSDKNKKHTVEAVVLKTLPEEDVDEAKFLTLIKRGLELGKGCLLVLREEKEEEVLFSEHLVCSNCHFQLPPIEPRLFSFNSPYGACPDCTGLGLKMEIDSDLIVPNKKLSLAEGAIKPWTLIAGNQTFFNNLLEAVAKKHGFSLRLPVGELKAAQLNIVLNGTGDEKYAVGSNEVEFSGVIPNLMKRYRETDSDYLRGEIESYMRESLCPACNGKRLRPEVLAVTLSDLSISDAVGMSIDEAQNFFSQIVGEKVLNQSRKPQSKTKSVSKPKAANYKLQVLGGDDLKIAKPIVKEILTRIKNLIDVGLEYLSLNRSAVTLSGGEAQRVRLSTQLNTSLSGVIYVLDEPSIGLHTRDVGKLVTTLKNLRDLGNTVITVEHDEATMRDADYIIDVGPGAGEHGGQIVAMGTPSELIKNKKSLTAAYLRGDLEIDVKTRDRKGQNKFLVIQNARGFNLKNIDVKIPLGKFICVTGVSGSGKSTLVVDILAKALAKKLYRAKDEPAEHKAIKGIENVDKVISIDQSPIGRTPRSNPATYTGVFTNIRDLFTEIPEAKLKGYDAGKFSFNVKGGGRCEPCAGEGYMRIEMQFMPDVFVECKECHGKRYNQPALEIQYKEKNIADILSMTVDEAREFFSAKGGSASGGKDTNAICEKLKVLSDVGLGYLRLGQPANNLSGGEAQRVKLATELSRRETGKTLYILDEPTTGLHFEDIKKLLSVLHQLVDKGNTILVIEHNLDVIKSADWVIDLGPGGGRDGGYLVAEGAPRDIARVKASFTGQYLKHVL